MLSLTNYHNTSIFFTNYPDWCSPEQIIRTPFKNMLFCYFNKGHCKRKKTDIKSKETMFQFKNRDRGKKNIFLTSLSKKCLLFWWWALSDRRAARQLTRKLKQRRLAISFLVLSISGWGGGGTIGIVKNAGSIQLLQFILFRKAMMIIPSCNIHKKIALL